MNAYLATPVEDRVPGHPMAVVASLTDNAPILNASVLATVEKPSGGLVYFWLWDDGNHGDGVADDGIYAGTFYQTGENGSYNLTINASAYSPSLDEYVSRSAILSFHMAMVDEFGNELPYLDTDGDGLPDAWEIFWGTDPNVPDSGADPDNDGWTNTQEWQNGTDPFDPDTDDDGEADNTDSDPFEPAPNTVIPPDAHAYPGDGQVFIKYTIRPEYAYVGLFRDEDDDLDDLYTYLTQHITPTLVGVFTDTGLLNGHQYCYVVAAIDSSNRRSTLSAPTCAVPNADPVGPHGGVTINDGDSATLTPAVTLNLWATDAVDPEVDSPAPDFLPPADSATGVTQMMISNAPDFAGASWEAYATSKPWTLAQSSGLATVYVKYQDAVGNESEVYVATIWVSSGPGISQIYLPIVKK
jgi:hypothetical protein